LGLICLAYIARPGNLVVFALSGFEGGLGASKLGGGFGAFVIADRGDIIQLGASQFNPGLSRGNLFRPGA
jgi:hypothetical protein